MENGERDHAGRPRSHPDRNREGHPGVRNRATHQRHEARGPETAGETGKGGRGVAFNKGPLIKSAIEQFNKKQPVLTSEEIDEMNKIFYDGINEIKTRERDIKV